MKIVLGWKPPPQKTPQGKAVERIVISGTGTVTPQGCSTWTTALGLRHKKTAFCEHETVLLPADRHGIVLRGATVSRVPDSVIAPDLDGAERAAALLSPALADCLAQFSPREVRCLDCRIDSFLSGGAEELIRILRKKFPLLAVDKATAAASIQPLGRCTFFERIMKAAAELQRGPRQRIVVACVDSLCATSWLMTVRDDGVLKDSLTPEGIIAGEAAGAVLLERESAARTRGAPVLAVLSSWGRGTEREGTATGGGVCEAFTEASPLLRNGANGIHTVIADLNGQRHRALDWAYAEGRLFSESERERELRHPAFILGDCGAATGAVLVADAIGRFAFHPGFDGTIALATSDDLGTRRVLCLERGDRFDRRELIRQIREGAAGGAKRSESWRQQ